MCLKWSENHSSNVWEKFKYETESNIISVTPICKSLVTISLFEIPLVKSQPPQGILRALVPKLKMDIVSSRLRWIMHLETTLTDHRENINRSNIKYNIARRRKCPRLLLLHMVIQHTRVFVPHQAEKMVTLVSVSSKDMYIYNLIYDFNDLRLCTEIHVYSMLPPLILIILFRALHII